MNNNKQPIEDFLKQTWNKTQVPSRTEFRDVIERVTKLSNSRINQYEGNNHPSPYRMYWKKIGIGILSAGALAIVVFAIIPRSINPTGTTPDGIAVTETQSDYVLESEAMKYAVEIPPVDATSSIDLAVRDIYLDAIAEAEAAQTEQYEDVDYSATLDEFNS